MSDNLDLAGVIGTWVAASLAILALVGVVGPFLLLRHRRSERYQALSMVDGLQTSFVKRGWSTLFLWKIRVPALKDLPDPERSPLKITNSAALTTQASTTGWVNFALALQIYNTKLPEGDELHIEDAQTWLPAHKFWVLAFGLLGRYGHRKDHGFAAHDRNAWRLIFEENSNTRDQGEAYRRDPNGNMLEGITGCLWWLRVDDPGEMKDQVFFTRHSLADQQHLVPDPTPLSTLFWLSLGCVPLVHPQGRVYDLAEYKHQEKSQRDVADNTPSIFYRYSPRSIPASDHSAGVATAMGADICQLWCIEKAEYPPDWEQQVAASRQGKENELDEVVWDEQRVLPDTFRPKRVEREDIIFIRQKADVDLDEREVGLDEEDLRPGESSQEFEPEAHDGQDLNEYSDLSLEKYRQYLRGRRLSRDQSEKRVRRVLRDRSKESDRGFIIKDNYDYSGPPEERVLRVSRDRPEESSDRSLHEVRRVSREPPLSALRPTRVDARREDLRQRGIRLARHYEEHWVTTDIGSDKVFIWRQDFEQLAYAIVSLDLGPKTFFRDRNRRLPREFELDSPLPLIDWVLKPERMTRLGKQEIDKIKMAKENTPGERFPVRYRPDFSRRTALAYSECDYMIQNRCPHIPKVVADIVSILMLTNVQFRKIITASLEIANGAEHFFVEVDVATNCVRTCSLLNHRLIPTVMKHHMVISAIFP